MGESVMDVLRGKIKSSARIGTTKEGKEVRAISFRDFMSDCLYDPRHGYYSSGKVRIGRSGDFYTSAYVGEAFSECLAKRLVELGDEHFGTDSRVEVIDWGGGTGRLAAQVLSAWEEAGATRYRMTVVDGNPVHRREAQVGLERWVARGHAEILSPEKAMALDWSERNAIVVGNELLDAMPVHRFARREGRLREWGVAWDERKERFDSCLLDPPAWLAEWMERNRIRVREDQTFEAGRDAEQWITKLSAILGRSLAVFIDYGDEAEELTGEHRMNGTLVCYRNHRAFDDPYEAPGETDLTAHVNFTGIRSAALEAGWEELWYGTQKRFLLEASLLQGLVPLTSPDPFHPAARRNRAIRQLLLSDGMSELFKVQIFRKEN